jgi:hypothetical protein
VPASASRSTVSVGVGDGPEGVDGLLGPVLPPGVLGGVLGVDLPGLEGGVLEPDGFLSSLLCDGSVPVPSGISWVPLR